jgi:catechol 2,3-dioxygenase-like lactoylglutathione lyase family enzyme
MNILGPDALVFGVDDVAACCQYLTDYGLRPVDVTSAGGRFEALDGTAIVIRPADDAALPPALGTGSMLRETVYGVANAATLQAIADELAKDRPITRGPAGEVCATDDMGFALRFQITVRRAFSLPAESVNAPGAPVQRGPNQLGTGKDIATTPRSLSHVVYFVPDVVKAEAFYARLGFVPTDRFTGVGPFLRPAGMLDHHTLFLIQTPPFMKGVEHFTFHLGGPSEVMMAGTRFQAKGYESFWGPGRHIFGSNWFWYFNSPFGCHMEMDADMDLHDASWQPRHAELSADSSQAFLLGYRRKWAPGPDTSERGDYA